ncbi:MAG TPA: peptidoglycan DD-metalloendopeptidase family protein [Eubacteriales bacterium]|jgi:murein DD-endopeptidase MepM/ murein hydrolase activator NlpD|nr:peptidoglycan DD-metalloendopeptidase family protein [Eubacteriales bacterium]HRU84241.1 peptidoglycan DD-metalloendopeptidase family protein [Eubacteriales bacterium]
MVKLAALILTLSALFCCLPAAPAAEGSSSFIRWVDCNIPYEVLLSAYEYEVKYHNTEVEFDFVKALAYLAVKCGNKFRPQRDIKALSDLVLSLIQGKKIDDYFGGDKYYKYYVEAYGAIFAEFIGDYVTESGEVGYGLKNYHPFPKGYWYTHYDDFGASRSFGFKRKHLGHDLLGSIGTPIAAVEGGIVTEFGWNRYGGWRIGIRSFDKKRSYYYAHLRKNKPYIEGLKKGDTVAAGQIIGYLGVTGYSLKENSNMSGKPHLHLGMQLIFDESQYQGPSEIWIDLYDICKFLSHNRAEVYKEGSDYKSKNLKISLSRQD